MGILSEPPYRVNSTSVTVSSSRRREIRRNLLAITGLILWIVFLVPPILAWTGQYEFVQSIQYCQFAIVIPFLLAAGAPWRWVGLMSNESLEYDSDGALVAPSPLRLLDRIAESRARQKGHRRAVILVVVYVGQSILWRSAPLVNLLVRHPWLSSVESVTLVGAGILLWLELVESPPFRPSTPRPYRIGVAALAMWTLWVIAYLMDMAQNSWYSAFHYVAGQWPSSWLDQLVTTGLLWFISAIAFLPVVFANLNRWLQSEDDPDDELYQLVRTDQTRGFFGTRPS